MFSWEHTLIKVIMVLWFWLPHGFTILEPLGLGNLADYENTNLAGCREPRIC